MNDAVCKQLGIGDLEIDDRVDLHGDVILGDDRLRREVGDTLFEGDLIGDTLYKGDFEVKSGLPGLLVCAETLDDKGTGLRDDYDVGRDKGDDKDDKKDYKDNRNHTLHSFSSFAGSTISLTPDICCTVTSVPQGIRILSLDERAVQIWPDTRT